MNSFRLFVYLNLLDVMTTLAVLHAGGSEMNPVTRWALGLFPGRPALALLLAKITSMPVYYGLLVWSAKIGLKRDVVLRAWNGFYMLLVVWNLSNLI